MESSSALHPSGLLQLLAGALLISFSSIMVRVAHVGPTAAGFYRVSFGGAALLAVLLLRRQKLFYGWRPLLGSLAAGFFFFMDLAFWHHSIVYVGPGLATILANFQVFFLSGVAVLFLGERLTLKLVLAVVLSIIGLVMVVGPDWNLLGPDYRLGIWLGIITAMCYTAYLLSLRRVGQMSPKQPPLATMALVSVISALFMVPEVMRQGESWAIPDLQTWSAMLGLGLGCHALGWVLISTGLPKFPASKAALILLLQPTCAFIWDLIFFARPTGLMGGLGAALTLGAIYLGLIGRSAGPPKKV